MPRTTDHEDAKFHWQRWETQKFLGSLLFTACLNWADFFSDWYVILQYGCVVDASTSTVCIGAGELQGCQVYPRWFAIGLSVLIASNLVQSAAWAHATYGRMGIEDLLPEGRCARLVPAGLLFLLAFFQLHYLLEIAVACHKGAPDLSTNDTDDRRRAVLHRELATKILESAPQLYLQSYILFAIGPHGETMKAASVLISTVALSHGLLKSPAVTPQRALSRHTYWLVSFLWLASDLAMRSAGYALVLSPGVRHYGIVLVVWASLVSCSFHALADNRSFLDLSTAASVLGDFFALYLVPAVALQPEAATKAAGVLLLRWLETATCALWAYAYATTSCGDRPTSEVLGLVVLLVFSVVCFAIRHLCFNQDTGDFVPGLAGFRIQEDTVEAVEAVRLTDPRV